MNCSHIRHIPRSSFVVAAGLEADREVDECYTPSPHCLSNDADPGLALEVEKESLFNPCCQEDSPLQTSTPPSPPRRIVCRSWAPTAYVTWSIATWVNNFPTNWFWIFQKEIVLNCFQHPATIFDYHHVIFSSTCQQSTKTRKRKR